MNKHLLVILCFAAVLRLFNINWDQNQHLHPDERFLTMVSTDISWPKNPWQYFDTDSSPLNPHNQNFGSYVYGTWPVFLTKGIADGISKNSYDDMTLVGRFLSAFFDVGTALFILYIARQLITQGGTSQPTKGMKRVPILATFFYAIMVLPIQLAHFYAVDSFLTFFIVYSFFWCTKLICTRSNSRYKCVMLPLFISVSMGLATSTKISALLFSPVIILTLFMSFPVPLKRRLPAVTSLCIAIFMSILPFYLTVRIAYPYLFVKNSFLHINPHILKNWNDLKPSIHSNLLFPPDIQWVNTKAYIYPLKNLVYWGIGFPMSSIFLISLFYIVTKIGRTKIFNAEWKILLLILLWVIGVFSYQGGQFSKNMRYFLPLYPFLAILSAYGLIRLSIATKHPLSQRVVFIICILATLPGIAFLSIYAKPHTRITASEWIYKHIPPHTKLGIEDWDDGLHLFLADKDPSIYENIPLTLYDEETDQKWIDHIEKLKHIDYIILSSNRLFGSIPSVPSRYPVTTKFYETLFDGSLGFQLMKQVTSRPTLPFPPIHLCIGFPGERYGIISKKVQTCDTEGISFVDDYADESFTVYDHPKVLIFKKIRSVDYANLLYN